MCFHVQILIDLMSNLVSIIIPCYNRAPLLRQAIASCALQTWREMEIIVVDDGSEEALEPAVSNAREKYGLAARLKYIRQQRSGGGAARNNGFHHASGEFIQYLDSDDLLHPEKLTIQAEYLLARPHLDMVFCLAEQFSKTLGDISMLWNIPRRYDCIDDLDRFLREDAVWDAASPVWRRRAIEKIGGWNEDLPCWQDWEFHVAALCSGIQYEFIGRVLEYIRHHQGPRSSWNSLPRLQKEHACFQAGKLAHEHLLHAGMLGEDKKSLLLFYFLRHIAVLQTIQDNGKARLRREILSYVRCLATGKRRRLVISIIGKLGSTPIFQALLNAYIRRLSCNMGIGSLRNMVEGIHLSEPPEKLKEIVNEAF
jgi:glycosyltransferase involved in cell wall biosynthesis